ncbi:hypothetical protein G6F23_016074 [Rhizopus arrhizus]|nr:hypothetical protein G6F23_016074 [Rhizopus arrhizus]
MKSASCVLPSASGVASGLPISSVTAPMSTGTHSLSIVLPSVSTCPAFMCSWYTAPAELPSTFRPGTLPSIIDDSTRDMAL